MPPVLGDAMGIDRLNAVLADLPDGGVHTEVQGGVANLGFWGRPSDAVSWTVQLAAPGIYEVATDGRGTTLNVGVGGVRRTFKIERPAVGTGS